MRAPTLLSNLLSLFPKACHLRRRGIDSIISLSFLKYCRISPSNRWNYFTLVYVYIWNLYRLSLFRRAVNLNMIFCSPNVCNIGVISDDRTFLSGSFEFNTGLHVNVTDPVPAVLPPSSWPLRCFLVYILNSWLNAAPRTSMGDTSPNSSRFWDPTLTSWKCWLTKLGPRYRPSATLNSAYSRVPRFAPLVSLVAR